MNNKGFTLLELVIALGIWLVLSLGVFFVWQYASDTSFRLIGRQSALENARTSMDALVMNIQLSHEITLQTDGNNILQQLTVRSINPQGQLHDYIFEFNVNAPYGAARHGVLVFGANEFTSGIGRIYMAYIPGNRIDIGVHTNCPQPIVLHGSVDARFKRVTLL